MAFKFNPITGNLDLVNAETAPAGLNGSVQYNDGGVFGGDANLNWNKTTKKLTTRADALASTPTTSVLLENQTLALTGARIQASPAFEWRGNGWKTNSVAASQPINFRAFAVPITASVSPIANWKLQYSVNNGAFIDALAYQNQVFDGVTNGLFTVSGLQKISGSNSATVGTLQNLDIANTGTQTHLTYSYSGTIRQGFSGDNQGTVNFRTVGPQPFFNFLLAGSNIESASLIAQIYGNGIYNSYSTFSNGVVTAGSADTSATTKLSSYGSFALKGITVTAASYTLSAAETMVYVDPSGAQVCSGTPAACNTYTTEAPCNSHTGVGCSWFAGNSCSGASGTDSGTCTGQGIGCVWDEVPCSSADNTDQSTCENQNLAYGGNCTWDTSTCPSQSTQGTCEAIGGCTWNFSDCATFNGSDQSTCENNVGCTWTGGDCAAFDNTDQSTCESGHTGCTWDSGTSLCTGVYNEGSTCAGQYDTSCTGSLCGGNYNNGNCSGTYGATCQGTASCGNLTDDGQVACNAESGCTWETGVNLTMPTTANANRSNTARMYSIVNLGGGLVTINPNTSQEFLKHGSSITLPKKGDRVLLHFHNQQAACGVLSTEGSCNAQTPSCTWQPAIPCATYDGDETGCLGLSGCSYDPENSTCSGTGSPAYCSGGSYTVANFWAPHVLQRGPIFEQTASVTVANSTTETTLIGAGNGSTNLALLLNKTITIKAFGVHSSQSNPNLTIRVKLGSTVILTTNAVSMHNDTNGLWDITAMFTVRSVGLSGTIFAQGVFADYGTSGDHIQMRNTAATTVNTTVGQILNITAQWGTASASNTITMTNLVVESDD